MVWLQHALELVDRLLLARQSHPLVLLLHHHLLLLLPPPPPAARRLLRPPRTSLPHQPPPAAVTARVAVAGVALGAGLQGLEPGRGRHLDLARRAESRRAESQRAESRQAWNPAGAGTLTWHGGPSHERGGDRGQGQGQEQVQTH